MSRDRYRCAFDSVADTYERSRPEYAEAAVDWVAQRLPFGAVLDLGAGTGKLTRQVLARGADVVAVEPADEMRALLERVVPGVLALAGEAEAIPLPDGSCDAVVVGQAFHWFRTAEALAEMHRVLRSGGGYALFWNEWDDDDQPMHALNDLVDGLRPDRPSRRELPDWWPVLTESPFFGEVEERDFRYRETLDADRVVDRIRSVSAYIAAPAEAQSRVESEVRALLGTGHVDLSAITKVVVADRL